MSKSARSMADQARFWLIALVVFAFLIWLLSPVLLPFVAGFAIAYFLHPAVSVLQTRGLPRWGATGFILLCFVVVVAVVLALLVPLLQSQISDLIASIPAYSAKVQAYVQPKIDHLLATLSPGDMERLRAAASQHGGSVVSWIASLLQHVLSGGLALFDILALLIVTPLVAFYMLRDWLRIVKVIDGALPRPQYTTIKAELKKVDDTLDGFVRGQAMVCLFLATFYAIGLSLTGLDYGSAIGITAGVLSFIPYVGTAFGILAALIICFLQYTTWEPYAFVLAVFFIGQFIESYFLTPKLVGDRVGLHPVWILFALMAGGSLLGFLGVLIAVPVAAIIGVGVRFLMRRYKASTYYSA